MPAVARTALSGKEWRVLILLLLSALINYIDRTTLSVAATDIQRDLHLTNTQLGELQSAFFATYALSQLSFLAGWVVGRFHVGWVLAGASSCGAAPPPLTGFATAFAVIFSLRLLLGVGESVTLPVLLAHPGQRIPGAPPRHRQRADRFRHQGRSRAWHPGRRTAGIAARMARLLLRARRRLPALADSLDRSGCRRARTWPRARTPARFPRLPRSWRSAPPGSPPSACSAATIIGTS